MSQLDTVTEFDAYETYELEDGTWECCFYADNSIRTTGETETEALKKMINELHHTIGVNCEVIMKQDEKLKKATDTLNAIDNAVKPLMDFKLKENHAFASESDTVMLDVSMKLNAYKKEATA